MDTPELWRAIFNTALVCLGSIAVAVPTGSCLAVLLMRSGLVGRQWVWIGIDSQLTLPLYVVAGSWNAGFGSQGWWPFSQVVAVRFELAGFLAVIFVHGIAAIPWVCLILSCGLHGAQRGLEEMGILEGGSIAVLKRVILPQLWPWLALACLWTCVPVLTEMVVTNLYQVPTVAEQVYIDTSRGVVSPLTYPAAILLCLMPVALFIWIALRRLPPMPEFIARARQHPPRLLTNPKWQTALSALCWLLLTFIVFLPLMNLIIKAGWSPWMDANKLTRYSWSPIRFARTLVESCTLFGSEFYWSSILALLAASLSLGGSLCLYAAVKRRWRWLVHLSMLLMLGTPGAVVGMLLISIFNRTDLLGWLYDRTMVVCILAQQFRLLPLAWLLTQGIVGMLDRTSLEMAKVDGLSRWQKVRSVVWPQTGVAWIVAWSILCIVSLGELSTTILVLPPGVTTLSLRLFEMLHYGMRHQDSGLCLILVFIGWISSWAIWKTLNDRQLPGN